MADGLKLNRKAVRDLLKSHEILRALHDEAEAIAARAGEGYRASSMVGKNRARASVITETPRAMYNEAKFGTLSKAAGGG